MQVCFSLLAVKCLPASQAARCVHLMCIHHAAHGVLHMGPYALAVHGSPQALDVEHQPLRFTAAGMRLLGVQPSTVSFNSLLSACERCNEPDRALEVFHTMQRSVVSTSGYVNPSPIT